MKWNLSDFFWPKISRSFIDVRPDFLLIFSGCRVQWQQSSPLNSVPGSRIWPLVRGLGRRQPYYSSGPWCSQRRYWFVTSLLCPRLLIKVSAHRRGQNAWQYPLWRLADLLWTCHDMRRVNPSTAHSDQMTTLPHFLSAAICGAHCSELDRRQTKSVGCAENNQIFFYLALVSLLFEPLIYTHILMPCLTLLL